MNLTKTHFGVAFLFILTIFFASCDNGVPQNSAGGKLDGTYSGTVQISGDTSIQQTSGYELTVTALSGTRVLIETANFPSFEADVMLLPSGVNNETDEDAQIVWVSFIDELTVQHSIGNNSLQFTGSK